MSESELKPCPFCGAENRGDILNIYPASPSLGQSRWHVFCDDCGAEGPGVSTFNSDNPDELCEAAWNRRSPIADAATIAALVARVEALEAENARLSSLAKANNDLARIEVAYRKQLAFQRAEMANALEAVTSQYGDRLPAQVLADLTAMLMRPALRAGATLETING